MLPTLGSNKGNRLDNLALELSQLKAECTHCDTAMDMFWPKATHAHGYQGLRRRQNCTDVSTPVWPDALSAHMRIVV